MKFIKKSIQIIFSIIFIYTLFSLFFLDKIDYYLNRDFLFPNILSLVFIIVTYIIYYCFFRNIDQISNKKFKITTSIIFIIVFILQLVLSKNIYFYSDWDVKSVRDISDQFLEIGDLKHSWYLTMCPNNIFITFLLVLIKSIPILGNEYMFLLSINCLLVNLSCLFTSLTVKNINGNNSGLLSYLVTIPFIALNPWITIPYTDTFSIMFPILILYIYTKKEKKFYDWILIGIFSWLGFYIKPTVIIVLISIIIIEIISNIKNIKEIITKICLILCGIVIVFPLKNIAIDVMKFEKIEGIPTFDLAHYLALGQNNETLGAFSEIDATESKVNNSTYNINKFKDRLFNRSVFEQIEFFTKKTLLNFNDGTFSWGIEGEFFYIKTPTNNKFSENLREIYYEDGKYYELFKQVMQSIWLLILFFCPFVVNKNNKKNEICIMLALIGMIMFVTIFEARTRYFYSYIPLFAVCFAIGIKNFGNIKLTKIKEMYLNSANKKVK